MGIISNPGEGKGAAVLWHPAARFLGRVPLEKSHLSNPRQIGIDVYFGKKRNQLLQMLLFRNNNKKL